MIYDQFFKKVRDIASKSNIRAFQQGSIDWYRRKIGDLTNKPNAREIIRNNRVKSIVYPGSMYMYVYDAKWKDHPEILPYWDVFPLTIVLKKLNNGFIGLNLHYLPPKQRGLFLGQLYDLRSNSRLDEQTKLRVTYQILKNATEYKLFKPCIKRYLYNHVKTNYARIQSQDWLTAVFLPTNKFVGAPNTKVWSDSILISQGQKIKKK